MKQQILERELERLEKTVEMALEVLRPPYRIKVLREVRDFYRKKGLDKQVKKYEERIRREPKN